MIDFPFLFQKGGVNLYLKLPNVMYRIFETIVSASWFVLELSRLIIKTYFFCVQGQFTKLIEKGSNICCT